MLRLPLLLVLRRCARHRLRLLSLLLRLLSLLLRLLSLLLRLRRCAWFCACCYAWRCAC